MRLGSATAIVLAGVIAGVLDLSAVLGFWALRDVAPSTILQSIASSVLGRAAFDHGAAAAALGLFLHFAVSFAFAAAYVFLSARLRMLRSQPLLMGTAYGALAYAIMTFVVVPLSLMDARPWPPPPLNLAASIFIHLFLFGLPIALVASRIDADVSGANLHEK